MYKLKRFFQNIVKQAKMVRWPSKKDMILASTVVLAIIAISAIALSLDDLLVARLLQALDETFKTETEPTSSAVMMLSELLK